MSRYSAPAKSNMPLLAYCITEADRTIKLAGDGVHGVAMESVSAGGLRCFVSRYDAPAGADGYPAREAALEFHRVLQDIFRQAAVVPFRFPTLLAGESEIGALLRNHGDEYARALSRLKDKVQVDVRISISKEAPPDCGASQSGTDYLRGRQAKYQTIQAAMRQVREAGGPWLVAWREREAGNGARCFALVNRASVAPFLDRMKAVRLPSGVIARATGPWPPAEFLKESE